MPVNRSPQGLGYRQTWKAVTRNSGTTYTNTSTQPIEFKVSLGNTSSFTVYVNGVAIGTHFSQSGTTADCSVTVPPGATYSFVWSSTNSPFGVWELS